MVKDSLKKQLKAFPHFLDKSSDSNFYKIQSVFNNQFRKLDQAIFEVYESFKLDKRVLVWKDQNEPYVYTMRFSVSFPNLKSVKIYKNDELIYVDEFSYENNVNNSEYSYEYDTRFDIDDDNNGVSEEGNSIMVEADIIPQDTFLIIVETYDEHIIKKGFPENDTPIINEKGERVYDVYDHDESLDELGVLNNIPRKQYIPTTDYENTEPPFNDRLTEDDYHYMKRQLAYLQLIQNVPLPVAEIFKLYGIEATMLNRERLLLKMFDLKKHGYMEYGGDLYVDSWVPEPWEHKDGFCKNLDERGKFFFVKANTVRPPKFSEVIFYFSLMDMYGESLDYDCTIDIYLDGEPLQLEYTDSSYTISTDNLNEIEPNLFRFIAKTNEDIIGEQEIIINVKGCNDGDFYVTSEGDDENDGSKDAPFASIKKALDSVNENQNLIIIGGEVILDDLNLIKQNCTIMGCNNGTIISPLEHNRFFNIFKDITVNLTDLILSHNYAEHYSRKSILINKNKELENYETVILHGGLPVLTLEANQDEYYHLYDNVILSFSLNSKAGNPLKYTILEFYINNELFGNVRTDAEGNGEILLNNQSITPVSFDYKLKFNETDVFYENTIEKTVVLDKTTPRIDRKWGPFLEVTAEYDKPADLYENGSLIHDGFYEEGIVKVNYRPGYGEKVVYFSEDGIQVIKEWVVNSRFYISDLDVPYLVTNVEINDIGELYVTFTPLSDFTKVQDLRNVIVNLELEGGLLYKEYFTVTNLDTLEGNEIYPEDLINLKRAIVNVTLDDGNLEIERIDTIIIDEEV